MKRSDAAVIISSSGNAEITACALAQLADTIPSKIISGSGIRVKKYLP